MAYAFIHTLVRYTGHIARFIKEERIKTIVMNHIDKLRGLPHLDIYLTLDDLDMNFICCNENADQEAIKTIVERYILKNKVKYHMISTKERMIKVRKKTSYE